MNNIQLFTYQPFLAKNKPLTSSTIKYPSIFPERDVFFGSQHSDNFDYQEIRKLSSVEIIYYLMLMYIADQQRKNGECVLPAMYSWGDFLLVEYDELEGIAWEWQSADSTSIEAPLARESVGPNPTGEQAPYPSGRAWRPAVDSRQCSQSA